MKNVQQATTIANRIVNMLNERYNLNLLTVDSAAMSEDIVKILYPMPDTPTIGFNCKVLYDGNLWEAVVESLDGNAYTAVIKGTGVRMGNIPFSTWRPF